MLDNVGTMALQIDRNILRERLVTYLAAAFGALALLLGCIGLYGVLSYSVARRTQEFGVRLALGARPFDLTRDVLGDASRVVVAGAAIGLLAALWVSGLLDALLFEVSAFDPIVAIASAALLTAASPRRELRSGKARCTGESNRCAQDRLNKSIPRSRKLRRTVRHRD